MKSSTEHPVPEGTSDTEAIGVVGKVVFKVISLKALIEGWEPETIPDCQYHKYMEVDRYHLLLMVEKVVSHVIAYVPKNTASEGHRRCIPVIEEDGVCKPPEGRRKNNKQSRWHHKAVLIHGKVVVNSVQEEMQGYPYSVIGKEPDQRLAKNINGEQLGDALVNVKQKSVHEVLY